MITMDIGMMQKMMRGMLDMGMMHKMLRGMLDMGMRLKLLRMLKGMRLLQQIVHKRRLLQGKKKQNIRV